MAKQDSANLKVAITGVTGQLGLHCRVCMKYKFGCDVIPIDRTIFNDDVLLQQKLGQVTAVVHLAGANRGDESEVYQSNIDIARRLSTFLPDADIKTLVFASSIHSLSDSSYGQSKKKAAEILRGQCEQLGVRFLNLVLPNLFGEFSKPYYNNFVGTFCEQAVSGKDLTVNIGATVELMHYGDVSELIGQALLQDRCGDFQPEGTKITVDEVAAKIQHFHQTYKTGVLPDLSAAFDVKLFNSYRQVEFDQNPVGELVVHSDRRGSFFECIRADGRGQTSISTTVKSVRRGDHFHFNKFERFIVLAGQARISIRKLYETKVHQFDVSGAKLVYVDIPTLHTHNIVNTGECDLLTLFWTNEFFDPVNSDTYVELL